jgi:hypothetical protein
LAHVTVPRRLSPARPCPSIPRRSSWPPSNSRVMRMSPYLVSGRHGPLRAKDKVYIKVASTRDDT